MVITNIAVNIGKEVSGTFIMLAYNYKKADLGTPMTSDYKGMLAWVESRSGSAV